MNENTLKKYKAYRPLDFPERTWPGKHLEQAPIWCAVDLRDGNQALPVPMDIARKTEHFRMLVEMGFKEIEVGFPSASEVEFQFIRMLIEENMIPDDVTIQVISQAREQLIKRTFESIEGAKRVIFHLYNSTSPAQREKVFRMDKAGITDIAVRHTKMVREMAARTETEIVFQYSPESFSSTEIDYAVEICQAVMDEWQPTVEKKMIMNLPATVEVTMPNIFADQIEYFCNNIKGRDKVIVSIHTHDDRGCGVAASEMALLAGGERIEGTLFGNGERTGNVDLITLVLNLYTQGVDPEIRVNDINEIRNVYERTTGMRVHERHPYAGELVYSAFSGSHQDAIRKGLAAQKPDEVWDVPYLPMDPRDVGRRYEEVIRINSQSGKGGSTYILESVYGYRVPREMQGELGKAVQAVADERARELTPEEIRDVFWKEFVMVEQPFRFMDYSSQQKGEGDITMELEYQFQGEIKRREGRGNGPLDGAAEILGRALGYQVRIQNYAEHALDSGSDAQAAAYVQVQVGDEQLAWGVATDTGIVRASLKALLAGVNRAMALKEAGQMAV